MLSDEDSRSALEDLLDNLELYSGRKDDQRSAIIGSDVRLNIYDMVSVYFFKLAEAGRSKQQWLSLGVDFSDRRSSYRSLQGCLHYFYSVYFLAGVSLVEVTYLSSYIHPGVITDGPQ